MCASADLHSQMRHGPSFHRTNHSVSFPSPLAHSVIHHFVYAFTCRVAHTLLGWYCSCSRCFTSAHICGTHVVYWFVFSFVPYLSCTESSSRLSNNSGAAQQQRCILRVYDYHDGAHLTGQCDQNTTANRHAVPVTVRTLVPTRTRIPTM